MNIKSIKLYRNIKTMSVINDRIFWIYFIVTVFFIIIGLSLIFVSNNPYVTSISILWLLSNILLMVVVYDISVKWAPVDVNNPQSQICFVDNNSRCFDSDNRVWLFINVIFIVLLILSTLWASELCNAYSNSNSTNNVNNNNQTLKPMRTVSGILIILGGLILTGYIDPLNFYHPYLYSVVFWFAIIYIVIWVGLTLYVVIN